LKFYYFQCKKSSQNDSSGTILQRLNSQRQAYSDCCDLCYKIDGSNNKVFSAHSCVLEACLGDEVLQYIKLLPQNTSDSFENADFPATLQNDNTIFTVPSCFQNKLIDDPDIKAKMKDDLNRKIEQKAVCTDISKISTSGSDDENNIALLKKDDTKYVPSENEGSDSDYVMEDVNGELILDEEEINDKCKTLNDSELSEITHECSICEKRFSSAAKLTKHLRDHLNTGTFAKQTHTRALRNREVDFVVFSHTDASKGTCCGEKFFSNFRHGVHILHKHTAVFVNCTECQKHFQLDELTSHYQTCHNFPSKEQTSLFSSETSLNKEEQRNRSKRAKTIALSDNKPNAKKLRKKKYKQKASSLLSGSENLWKKKRMCATCQKEMPVDRYLVHLNEQNHQLIQAFLPGVRDGNISLKYPCLLFHCLLCAKMNDVTPKRMSLRQLLHKHVCRYHLPNSVKDEKVTCEKCGASVFKFVWKNHLLRHNQRMVPCNVCGKSFSKFQLSKHRRIHFEKFSCSFCSKTFNKLWNLRVHERIHTGEKPYVCDKCGKGFHQKVELNLHKRQHQKNVINSRKFRIKKTAKLSEDA